MKKNKFITMGVCAAVLANIVTTPTIVLAESIAEDSVNTTETLGKEPVVEEPVKETPVVEVPPVEVPVPEVPTPEVPTPSNNEKPTAPVVETPEIKPSIKPETKPVKPEVKPVKPETNETKPDEDKGLTQAEKDAFMSKSTLVFQGVTYTYSEFLTFAD